MGYKQERRRGFLSVGGGGRIVGGVVNLHQNTLKIEKTPHFGHFILESGGRPPRFSKVRGLGSPTPPRRRRPWLQVDMHLEVCNAPPMYKNTPLEPSHTWTIEIVDGLFSTCNSKGRSI